MDDKGDSSPAGSSSSSPGGGDVARPEIADHELIRPIGRGSYGEVWLARSVMGVYRAVKVVYRSAFRDQRPYERELAGIRRFEPVSRLHEGFLDVLHVGNRPEYFYYVMELGDPLGPEQRMDPETYVPRTLGRELREQGRLPLEECLRLGLSLSGALHELHRRGLVHRDVKPSNIIFIDGTPKLADIGLVAEIGEPQSFVGTEGFVPPEGPGSPQADVFALGRVLYEVSTGLDRLDYPDLPADLVAVADLARFVEFNEVIIRACKRDPRLRYATAGDLQADLIVFANGKSLKRLRQLEERNKRMKRMAAIGSAGTLALALVLFPLYQDLRYREERTQLRVGARIQEGRQRVEEGDFAGAVGVYAEALRLDAHNPDRDHSYRMRLQSAFVRAPKLIGMFAMDGPVADARLLPDCTSVLVVERGRSVRLADLSRVNEPGVAFGNGPGLYRGSVSRDGRLVVESDLEGVARIWELATQFRGPSLRHACRVLHASFNPDASRVVTGAEDGWIRLWDARSGQYLWGVEAHQDSVVGVAVSPDGRMVGSVSRDYCARLWDAVSGEPLSDRLLHEAWVEGLAFSPDSRVLVTGGDDRRLRLWECPSGRLIFTGMPHPDVVWGVEFSPDGRRIVSACLDGSARVWDVLPAGAMVLHSTLRQGSRLLHASFDARGDRVITGGIDGMVRIWDLAGAVVRPAKFTGLGAAGLEGVVLTDDSRFCWASGMERITPTNWHEIGRTIHDSWLTADYFVTQTQADHGAGYELQVWDIKKGDSVGLPVPVLSQSRMVRFDPSRGRLICALHDNRVVVVDVSGRVAEASIQLEHAATLVDLSNDGRELAIAVGDEVRILDAATLASRGSLRHLKPVSHVTFSPDSRYLVAACSDDQLGKSAAQLWDLSRLRQACPPFNHRDGVVFAAFDSTGDRVVTASEDFTAQIWEVPSGLPLAPRLRHEQQVRFATFSSDGLWVATLTASGHARIWEAESGDPLTPPCRGATLGEINFIAGDSHVVVTDRERRGLVWDLTEPGRTLADWLDLGAVLNASLETPEELMATWRRLRTVREEDFTVTSEQRMVWHDQEAKSARRERNWRATLFHLHELRRLNPGDGTLKARIEEALQHLAQVDPAP